MKKKQVNHSKWYAAETILLYVAIIFIVFAIFAQDVQKNCNTNFACFEQAAKECNAAKLDVINHDNTYTYQIQGKEDENCIVSIQLIELSQNTPVEIVELFDQKGMVCSIPQDSFDPESLIASQGIIDECSGPLKEAMYELIIKRMYGVIAKNFGPILAEIEKLPI